MTSPLTVWDCYLEVLVEALELPVLLMTFATLLTASSLLMAVEGLSALPLFHMGDKQASLPRVQRDEGV